MIRDVSKPGANQTKERICGQMPVGFRRNCGHGKSCHEISKSLKRTGHCRTTVYEKTTGMTRWLPGSVARRELLEVYKIVTENAARLYGLELA
jgi:hypothetical protein